MAGAQVAAQVAPAGAQAPPSAVEAIAHGPQPARTQQELLDAMRGIFQNIFDRLREITNDVDRLILECVTIDELNDVPVDRVADREPVQPQTAPPQVPIAPAPNLNIPPPGPIVSPRQHVVRPRNRARWDVLDIENNLPINRSRNQAARLPTPGQPAGENAPQANNLPAVAVRTNIPESALTRHRVIAVLDRFTNYTLGRPTTQNPNAAGSAESQNRAADRPPSASPNESDPASNRGERLSAAGESGARRPLDPITSFFFKK